ncbi:hypothetical protein [Streptomyces sp. JH002]|uniref:hypothetical protein n=1 Tax=Streptomyces sp. JH002 TaxID=2763259 RepID=UPI003D800947
MALSAQEVVAQEVVVREMAVREMAVRMVTPVVAGRVAQPASGPPPFMNNPARPLVPPVCVLRRDQPGTGP